MVSISLFCDLNMADVTSREDTLHEIYFLKSTTSFTQRCHNRAKKEVRTSRPREGELPYMGYIGKKKKKVWVFTRFGNESGVESGKFALVSKRVCSFFHSRVVLGMGAYEAF